VIKALTVSKPNNYALYSTQAPLDLQILTYYYSTQGNHDILGLVKPFIQTCPNNGSTWNTNQIRKPLATKKSVYLVIRQVSKRLLPRHDLIHGATQRKNVSLGNRSIVPLPSPSERQLVARLFYPKRLLVVYRRTAKVAYPDAIPFSQEDIPTAEITVEDAFGMCVG
jgi:hypothetical protein